MLSCVSGHVFGLIVKIVGPGIEEAIVFVKKRDNNMDKYSINKQTYNELAKQYQDKFMDLEIYHHTYDFFCDLIVKQNPAILDIACGPGNITKYLLTKRPDFNVFAIDVAPNMIQLAKANNPSATFAVKDARDIGQLQQSFDGIICGFGLPYLSKPDAKRLIHDVAGLLNSGGVLYLSTMEEEDTRSGFKGSSISDHQVYIHYYQADELIAELEEQGFIIERIHRQAYPEADGTVSTDLFLLARLP